MPLRRHRLSSLIARLVLLSLAAVCLAVLRPAGRVRVQGVRALESKRKRRTGLRRAAVSLTFATLFFAGAAFSAGAGDVMVQLVEDQAASVASAAGEASADDPDCDDLRRSDWDAAECAEESSGAAESAPADGESEEPAAPEAAAEAGAGDTAEPGAESVSPESASPSTTAAIAAATSNVIVPSAKAEPESGGPGLQSAAREAGKRHSHRNERHDDHAPAVIAPQKRFKHAATPDPEVELPGLEPTIWLHRALPDPTPPSKRLTRPFATNLRYASAKHRVDWALMLGVLRARGERGSVPAGKAGLDRLGRNLARLGARNDQWSALLGLEGRTAFADRALALTRYHRAVGLRALVRGLESAKPRLTKKLLRDRRVSIYGGGRGDLAAGRIDVRVIVLIQYLAESHGQVSVSSLRSGHRIFSRPGVVSAHTYGQAVDIAGLAGKSIIGNQEPGGLTETAVRNVLLLPAELRPMQVISLLGLGGPSFPMGNHDDHIHLGF
jgi:hypothetical protein